MVCYAHEETEIEGKSSTAFKMNSDSEVRLPAFAPWADTQ